MNCPKCDATLVLTGQWEGERAYQCANTECRHEHHTVEVTQEYLRELLMARLGHSEPATA